MKFYNLNNYREVIMSLWVDKHRPNVLNKLDYHKEQATYLKKLVRILCCVGDNGDLGSGQR